MSSAITVNTFKLYGSAKSNLTRTFSVARSEIILQMYSTPLHDTNPNFASLSEWRTLYPGGSITAKSIKMMQVYLTSTSQFGVGSTTIYNPLISFSDDGKVLTSGTYGTNNTGIWGWAI